MLKATKLAYESDPELFPKFLKKIRDQMHDRIPPNFRLAYKDYQDRLSPGLIKFLQNYACDPVDEERWNEINAFMEKDLEAEEHNQIAR